MSICTSDDGKQLSCNVYFRYSVLFFFSLFKHLCLFPKRIYLRCILDQSVFDKEKRFMKSLSGDNIDVYSWSLLEEVHKKNKWTTVWSVLSVCNVLIRYSQVEVDVNEWTFQSNIINQQDVCFHFWSNIYLLNLSLYEIIYISRFCPARDLIFIR